MNNLKNRRFNLFNLCHTTYNGGVRVGTEGLDLHFCLLKN